MALVGGVLSGTYTGYADTASWDPWDVAFAASVPELAKMYDAGQLKWSPSELMYEPESVETEGLTIEDYLKDMLRQELGINKQDYYSFIGQWRTDQRAVNEFMIETGQAERYQLDPTPWDELTASDVEYQKVWYDIYEREKAREEENIASRQEYEDAEAARIAQEEEDIATIGELAELRGTSETLAIEDVDEYIDTTTQRLKLRGVGTGFTSEVREQLINERMSEYWSEENETLLTDLLNQYADSDYELPTLSGRTIYGTEATGLGTLNMTQPVITPANAAGESTMEQHQAALTAAMAAQTTGRNLLAPEEEEEYRSALKNVRGLLG